MRRTPAPARLLAAALAVAALSCGGDPTTQQQPISIHLLLDPNSCMFYCGVPDDCPLDCGGTLGLWVLDADTDEVIDSDCIAWDFASGQSLRALSGLIDTMQLDAPLAEGRRVAVEVAAFTEGTPEGCSRVHQDPSGDLPHTDDFFYPLYFARSEAALLGDDPVVIDTPVQCVATFSCDTISDVYPIQATVLDLDRNGPPENPQMLDVHTGSLFYDFTQDDLVAHAVFNFGTDLEWDDGLGIWRSDVDVSVIDPSCVGTIVSRLGPAFTAPTASCEGYQDETFFSAQAYFVDKDDMNGVLGALSMTEFPAAGLLIGRVIDGTTGLPAAGAVVTPDPPETTSTIVYLDTDGETGDLFAKPTGPTSANGWFVVTELEIPGGFVPGMGDPGRFATCCSYFSATGTDGSIGYSYAPVGLIDGVAMGTTIFVSTPDGTGLDGNGDGTLPRLRSSRPRR